MQLTRRRAVSLIAAASTAACARSGDAGGPPPGTLDWAIAGDWRTPAERARDPFRHPRETLEFWGLAPGMTVLEVYPGLGWYTAIIAPYLARNAGRLIVAEWPMDEATQAQKDTMAAFGQRFIADPDRFGLVERGALSPRSGPPAPAESVDLAIVCRNVHTFMAGGFAEKAFADLFQALKPGGVLGVEQHRGASNGVQDPLARTGYVQEAYVKALAAEAGFDFVAASDLNANPNDDRDHPFGVWTLPPTRRTAPLGQPEDPAFDRRPYDAVGESDRMTLKFRKRMPGEVAPTEPEEDALPQN
ncbi:MAG: methyltransferase [Alphaproteobacteria bacterium]|nr:methyltransferase [Alphaproteobacteria bacterium]